ncbi:homeobox protein Hox-A1-like [Monodelphis domestica]|uniref:homeobox protein Hox-A1-like n=1 Tax=Monodelphis domestica TaxID=13616 RepID=UPI0024E1F150|nr:homeobox protein Hox-A1-like [Monodelphis domestica]
MRLRFFETTGWMARWRAWGGGPLEEEEERGPTHMKPGGDSSSGEPEVAAVAEAGSPLLSFSTQQLTELKEFHLQHYLPQAQGQRSTLQLIESQVKIWFQDEAKEEGEGGPGWGPGFLPGSDLPKQPALIHFMDFRENGQTWGSKGYSARPGDERSWLPM